MPKSSTMTTQWITCSRRRYVPCFFSFVICIAILTIVLISYYSILLFHEPVRNRIHPVLAVGLQSDQPQNASHHRCILPTPISRVSCSPCSCNCTGITAGTLMDLDRGGLVHADENKRDLSKPNSSSRRVSLTKRNMTKIRSLTEKLWLFKSLEDQQLYIYESLLKQPWSPNTSSLAMLRKELAAHHPALNGSTMILMHHGNTAVNDTVRYTYERRSKLIKQDVHNLLLKENPISENKLYKTCAVIGNSGSLNDSKCGLDIDSSDFVIRCNLAPLKPFSSDAGTKSNLTTMNPTIIIRRYKNLGNNQLREEFNADVSRFRGVIVTSCFGFSAYTTTALRSMKIYRDAGREQGKGAYPSIACGHPSHFSAVTDFWKERGMKRRLSSGFYTVTTALQLCEEVHLYGFWPFLQRFADQKTNVSYHYFDSMPYTAKTRSVHGMDAEFNLLVQLHNMGVLRVHVGSCA